MTRISNETLGKTIVQVVKDFEKVVKGQEKNAKNQADELQKATDLAIEKIKTEFNKINTISFDLRPFEEKGNEIIERIEKVSENTKKQSNLNELKFKIILIYFGTLIIGVGTFYFFNTQAKELKRVQYKNEVFTKYILSDEKKLKEWNEYIKVNNKK